MMNFIIKNIKWIMLLSRVLTLTMFYGLSLHKLHLNQCSVLHSMGRLKTLLFAVGLR
jgi:hypothetical protein